MPVVRKRKRDDTKTEVPAAKRPPNKRAFTALEEFRDIGYCGDHCHTLIRNIPQFLPQLQNELMLYIGSFLNGDGGILCYGAKPNGVVYGVSISRKDEDVFKLCIDEVMKKMHPMVDPSRYRVTFTPVAMRSRTPSYFVVEIRISRGDTYQLYEDSRHEVFLRQGSVPYGPLKPSEIEQHTIRQLWAKLKAQRKVAALLSTPPPPPSNNRNKTTTTNQKNDNEEKQDKNKPTHSAPKDAKNATILGSKNQPVKTGGGGTKIILHRPSRKKLQAGATKENPMDISDSTEVKTKPRTMSETYNLRKKMNLREATPPSDNEAPLPSVVATTTTTSSSAPDNERNIAKLAPLDTNKQQNTPTTVTSTAPSNSNQAPTVVQKNGQTSSHVDPATLEKKNEPTQPQATLEKEVKPTQPKASVVKGATGRITRSLSKLLMSTTAPPKESDVPPETTPSAACQPNSIPPSQTKAGKLKSKLNSALGIIKSKLRSKSSTSASHPPTTKPPVQLPKLMSANLQSTPAVANKSVSKPSATNLPQGQLPKLMSANLPNAQSTPAVANKSVSKPSATNLPQGQLEAQPPPTKLMTSNSSQSVSNKVPHSISKPPAPLTQAQPPKLMAGNPNSKPTSHRVPYTTNQVHPPRVMSHYAPNSQPVTSASYTPYTTNQLPRMAPQNAPRSQPTTSASYAPYTTYHPPRVLPQNAPISQYQSASAIARNIAAGTCMQPPLSVNQARYSIHQPLQLPSSVPYYSSAPLYTSFHTTTKPQANAYGSYHANYPQGYLHQPIVNEYHSHYRANPQSTPWCDY